VNHFSKVLVELPEDDDEAADATVIIDCDVCGESEVKIRLAHLGSVMRALTQTLDSLQPRKNSITEPFGQAVYGDDEAARARVRAQLDRYFPEWKAKRLREQK